MFRRRDELRGRRERLCEAIRSAAPDAHAPSTTAWWAPAGKEPHGPALILVRGAPPSASTFRQSNDMYYLSAIEVPNAYLAIDTRDARTVVYLPHRSEAFERSSGRRLCVEDADAALALTGADEVCPVEELPAALGRRVTRRLAPVVFTPLAPAEGRRGTRDGELDIRAEALVDPFAATTSSEAVVRRGTPILFPTVEVRDRARSSTGSAA